MPAAWFGVNSTTYQYSYKGNGYISASGGAAKFWAPVPLPAGAILYGIEFWYYDGDDFSPINLSLTLFRPDQTVDLATWSSTGMPGFDNAYMATTTTLRNYNPNYQSYAVQVYIPNGDGDLWFQGVNLSYALQVSPAPATATFSDVPTDHPFFAFVEALAASGITSGCGGGAYCPDSPLTRGQMAVFLSKALGLHWTP